MNRLAFLMSVVFGLALLVSACAPKPVPAPSPSPATPPPTPRPQATAAPASSEWDKIVEAARKEGKVTMYTFSLTGDIGQAVAAAFESRYGVKVEFITGVGATLIERIKTEQAGKRFIADTLDTSTTLMAIALRDGITEPAGNLPTLAQKDVWLAHPRLDDQGHLIAFDTLYQIPYVNTTLVKAGDEPKSYRELLEPKWKGKMVTSDPNTIPYLPRLYAVMVSRKLLDDDFFKGIAKQDPKMAPTVRDDANMLIRGEAALSVTAGTTILNPFVAQGVPVKPIDVKEGAVLAMSPSIALVKNAPHPNAARLMMDWLVTAEGQTAYQKARSNLSVRTDVPDFTPAAGRIKPSKIVVSTIADELEAARLQREKVVTKLMGLLQ
ncbi:MAG: extracellular solute-binding protein [Chloroflexi bacterium]|nr:extracellular solute-binding protein [Chloroflexota bacterium]